MCVKEVSVESEVASVAAEDFQPVAQMNAFIELETETKALYTITEKSESCEVIPLQPRSGVDSPMEGIDGFDFEFDKAHLTSEWPLLTPLAPA